MRTQIIVRVLRPKAPGHWIVLCVFLFMFGVAVGPKLFGPKGLLLALAFLACLTALALAVPIHWIIWCERRPRFLRGLALGFFAYAATVTIGNFGELYSFRVWMEWVFLKTTGAAPFTPAHAAGIAGAIYASASQNYHLVFPSLEAQEWVLSGQALISYEDAKQRADQLFRD